MKITTLLFCLTFSVTNQLFGQNTIVASGQIKDEQSKENISFCKVVAYNPQDSIIAGAYTDEAGYFKIPLAPNVYKFVISAYGYTSDTLPQSYLRSDHFLGVIKLAPDIQNIGEVKVEGSTRTELLDRDVQVITEDLREGTSAAKDVLNKLNGVTFDQYTGTLKVDNDQNIMILVNGVEKNQEYVQNLDPERLLKVEILRDPGGRYGLEGYVAVINVILKDNYVGQEVYIEEMQLIDINTQKNKLDFLIGSLGVTYNYTKNKVNFYVGARAERKHFQIYSKTRTVYNDGTSILEYAKEDNPNIEILEYGANYTVGLDYRINPKHTLSYESYISALPSGTNQIDLNYQTDVFSNELLTQQYGFNSSTLSKQTSIYNTLFYVGKLDDKNNLNINFTHSYYADKYDNSTFQEDIFDRFEKGSNMKNFTRFYAEYGHNISPKMDIQLGIGNTYSQLNNDFNFTQNYFNPSTTFAAGSSFEQSDLRNKLYFNYSYRISQKWGLRAGLASENSQRRNESQNLSFTILQPLFDVRYFANPKLNFNLKYRTDSDYPELGETNPFLSQVNPRITSRGNPNLSPTTIHRFSLRIDAWKGLLALEPYSHISNNLVVKVGELDTTNMFNYRYENADLFMKNGLKMNFNKYFKFNLLLQGNLDVFSSTIQSSVMTNTIMDWRGDVDVIYIFPKTQSLVGLKYQRQQSKNNNALGYEKGDVDFWMLFYKTPLFKQRASLLFGYFLPVDLGAKYNQDSKVNTTGFTMHSDNDVSLVKNMFILEFSYRFNKGKSIKKIEKNIEREQEKKGGLF